MTHQDSLRDSSLLNAIHEIGPHMDNIPLPCRGQARKKEERVVLMQA